MSLLKVKSWARREKEKKGVISLEKKIDLNDGELDWREMRECSLAALKAAWRLIRRQSAS